MILDACNSTILQPFMVITYRILTLIQIIVPIILITATIIDLTKLMSNPETKGGNKKIFNKFIAAAIVFFLPVLINTTTSMIGEKTEITSCWNDAKEKPFFSSVTYKKTDRDKEKNKIISEKEYEPGDSPTSTNGNLKKTGTSKVLFVGNSKTYVHDIPGKFTSIASSHGYTVQADSVVQGGATLYYLSTAYSTQISQKAYDFVILQEQTDTYAANYSLFLSGGQRVSSLVKQKNPNVKIYVRANWISYGSSKAADQTAYSYAEKVAQSIGGYVIYDGKAFNKSRSQYPNIELFGDDIHQTAAGAYLSAATIFKTLSGENVTTTSYKGGLNTTTANNLLKIANTF